MDIINRENVEQAIVVLEVKRVNIGDGIVDVAVDALREKLALLSDDLTRYDPVAVLVADLSGFTAMSAVLDAELVRDMMNLLWQKLDSIVFAWGGQIDKHLGDGVIAFFGVPTAHADDAERAVQAALDMQLALQVLNQHSMHTNGLKAVPHFRMRIGIHIGSLLLGRMGEKLTAVGETLTIAEKLERLAPVDGVLVSQEIRRLTIDLFETEMRPAVALEEGETPLSVYLVKRSKGQNWVARWQNLPDNRLIGRANELQNLLDALQSTVDGRFSQIVTLQGEKGVGKSRLLTEFNRWLTMFPDPLLVVSTLPPSVEGIMQEALQAKAVAVVILLDNGADYFANTLAVWDTAMQNGTVLPILMVISDLRAPLGVDQEIKLQPLSFIDSRHLATDILSPSDTAMIIPPKLIDFVISRTNGNPLFMVTLIQKLINERILVKGGKEWRFQAHKVDQWRVPRTVSELLQSPS